jgi:hypothetical protein
MSSEQPTRQPPAPPRRLLWPWLAIVVVLILVGGFGGYGIDWFGETPREGWEAVTRAAEAGDWGAVWDRFDPASQGRLAPVVREYARGLDAEGTKGMSDRERYVFVMDRRPQSREQFQRAPILDVQRIGDRASLTLDRPSGFTPTSRAYMTRHGGRWCVSYGAKAP